MRQFFSKHLLLSLSVIFLLASCSTEKDGIINQETSSYPFEIVGTLEVITNYYDNEGPHEHHPHNKVTEDFMETFEIGSKGSYAAADVSLSSGTWHLSDALIGSLSSDRKYESKSMRIRNSGFAIMNFNMDNGANTISIRHAKFGSDGNSSWQLMASYDNGSTWYNVGSAVTTSSTSLNTVSYTLNETESVRYGIYKLSGGSNRINFDNIEITTGTPSGGGGGSETATQDSNITFGNPSDANTVSTNYYLTKPDFSLSYNNDRGTANWVSWHLSAAWTGSVSRCNCFKSDTDLPSNFFRATTSDYTNSGFDRGHLCPSADRNGTAESNENTYYMTNIAPQAPDNNQRSWATFENYLRSLTEAGNEVHIIAGVLGSGGTGRNGFASTIDNGNITVPDSFWKVALILPNGSDDVNRVTTSTRVIAINIPNDQGISTDWTQFKTTVDDIELLTGYDLLENITNSVEDVIESQVDNGPSA